uniref:Uncharacterized protein n=1 Tax=Anguilla anguilla TaxID=7936 RepID=A0A0E9PYZ7_ANGAN
MFCAPKSLLTQQRPELCQHRSILSNTFSLFLLKINNYSKVVYCTKALQA